MAIDRKPVRILYRKFNPSATLPFTLEKMVRAAMDTTENGFQIKDRFRARLNTIGSDNYFINTYVDSTGSLPVVFGDILHFTKGHMQALCDTADQNAATLPVQQMPAPEKSEYVHSQMYWLIKGNHALVIQSMSLRTPEFEQYLEWLLKSKTKQLSENHPVILDLSFDKDAVGGDLNDIQEIIVGGIASLPKIIPASGGTELISSEVTQYGNIDTGRTTGRSTALAILNVLLEGDAAVTSLMQSVPKDAELNVQVHIGYKTKKHKIDRVALRQLETGLRNLPDSQIQVKAKGEKVSVNGTISLHYNTSIKLIKQLDGENELVGSLLDPYDALRAMVEAYTTLLENGKIQA